MDKKIDNDLIDFDTLNENDEKKQILMQSRRLVNTCYEISYSVNKIYYYLLYKVQKLEEDSIALIVSLDENELKKLISRVGDRTPAKIKGMLVTLMNTQLFFIHETKGFEIENGYNLIAGYSIKKSKKTGEKIYEITFIRKVYEHIKKYNNYAPLDLSIMFNLKTFYSQRFYELFRMWSSPNKVVRKTFSIYFLRLFTGCIEQISQNEVKEKYKTYKSFKQRVLLPSLANINEFANMNIEFEEIKKGKQVVKIEFFILDRNNKKYFIKENKKENELEELNKIYIEAEKYVAIPNKNFFDEYNLKKFTKFCYDNLISFKDTNYDTIFYESLLQLAKKKSVEFNKIKIETISYYKYFESTIIGKIKDYEDNIKNRI